MKTKRTFWAWALVAVVAVGLAGCGQGNDGPKLGDRPTTSPDRVLNVAADASEADLVENMASARLAYRTYLDALREHYSKSGKFDKETWTKNELKDLSKVRQYVYLAVVDVPGQEATHPRDKIAEADTLYNEAQEFYKHLPLPLMHDQDRMRTALNKFVQVAQDYPTSDKVDDALFYAGFIQKEYFSEYNMAIEYFRRAYLADPRTPHPARFERAVVLEYRLGRRDEALQEYREVLKWEADRGTFWSNSNADFAASRIKELGGSSGK